MLFRKNIEKSCNYCIHGVPLEEEQILCSKKGIVTSEDKCRKFCYDPCKRIPAKPKSMDFSKYEQEDYSL